MRLDKYLKVSRIVKRRSVAKELLDLDRAEINGRKAKPSSEVDVGDLVKLVLKDRIITIRIEKVCDYVKGDEYLSMYTVLDEKLEEYCK